MASGEIAYVRQHQPLGLGNSLWCARHLIGDEPFAVILPDDIFAAQTPCLRQMAAAHAETGGCIVAAMKVSVAQTSSCGILDVDAGVGPGDAGERQDGEARA